MEDVHQQLFQQVFPALESKKNEFRMYQYDSVSEKDIWQFCLKKKWKKKDVTQMRLYEIVGDILAISPANYMTYTQIEEFKTADWFSELNHEELQLLLQPTKDLFEE